MTSKDAPALIIRLSSNGDPTFYIEIENDGGFYYDMLPHEVEQFLHDYLDQYCPD